MTDKSNFGTWIAWVIATALSGSAALAASAYLVNSLLGDIYFRSAAGLTGDNLIPHFFFWIVGLCLFVGPFLGIAQGLVLKVFAQYERSAEWTFVSALAAILILILVGLVGLAIHYIVLPLVVLPGFMYGAIQWILLRRTRMAAKWWIITNGVGWIIAVFAGYLIAANLLPSNWQGLPFYPVESVLYLVLTSFITLAIFATFTGTVLFNPFQQVRKS